MSNKSKFISSSATIIMVTSVVLGANADKALANPFSNLWQKLKTAGSSLTLSNPFKTSSSNSSRLNKPSSNGNLSNSSKTSNSLCSKLKSFFTGSSKKSYKVTTTGTSNLAFEDDVKTNTITHTLKGDNDKPASKSKEKRIRLATTYDNDTESLTSNINSSSGNSNNISNIKQPESKNKPKTSNPSVSFDQLSISSEDSSSSSETKTKSKKNSNLILDLQSELEARKILMNDELNHKSLLEKSINESNDVTVKQTLYSYLGTSNKKISKLESEIKNLEKLIKEIEN